MDISFEHHQKGMINYHERYTGETCACILIVTEETDSCLDFLLNGIVITTGHIIFILAWTNLFCTGIVKTCLQLLFIYKDYCNIVSLISKKLFFNNTYL